MTEMSARERSDLQQLARMNARVAKADVDALAAQRLAEFEEEAQASYSMQEMEVAHLVADVQAQVEAINEKLTAVLDEKGIHPSLRPRMLAWYSAKHGLDRGDLGDLRRVAKAELDAATKRAKVEIDRQTARVCTEIVASSLTSDQAREILARVDAPESLVPALSLEKVQQIKALGRGER